MPSKKAPSKSPAAKKAKPTPAKGKATADSPKRKKFERPKAGQMSTEQIVVAGGFHPFFDGLELATYSKKNDTQDGYLHSLKQCTRGFIECAKFSEAEVYTYVARRIPFGPNDAMLNPPEHKFERIVFLRYAPEMQSTKESREQLFCCMLALISDPKHAKYPAKNVGKKEIIPAEGEFLALDQFLMDDTIEDLVRERVDPSDLNTDFQSRFGDLSKCIYAGNHASVFAKTELGF